MAKKTYFKQGKTMYGFESEFKNPFIRSLARSLYNRGVKAAARSTVNQAIMLNTRIPVPAERIVSMQYDDAANELYRETLVRAEAADTRFK